MSCNKLFSNSCLVFNLHYYKFVVLDVPTLLFTIIYRYLSTQNSCTVVISYLCPIRGNVYLLDNNNPAVYERYSEHTEVLR